MIKRASQDPDLANHDEWEHEHAEPRHFSEEEIDEACRLLKRELEGPVGQEIGRILEEEER